MGKGIALFRSMFKILGVLQDVLFHFDKSGERNLIHVICVDLFKGIVIPLRTIVCCVDDSAEHVINDGSSARHSRSFKECGTVPSENRNRALLLFVTQRQGLPLCFKGPHF